MTKKAKPKVSGAAEKQGEPAGGAQQTATAAPAAPTPTPAPAAPAAPTPTPAPAAPPGGLAQSTQPAGLSTAPSASPAQSTAADTNPKFPPAVDTKPQHGPPAEAASPAQEPSAEQAKLPCSPPSVASPAALSQPPAPVLKKPSKEPSAALKTSGQALPVVESNPTTGPPPVPISGLQTLVGPQSKPQAKTPTTVTSQTPPQPTSPDQTKPKDDVTKPHASDSQPLDVKQASLPVVSLPTSCSKDQKPTVTQAKSPNVPAAPINSAQLPTEIQPVPSCRPHSTVCTNTLPPETLLEPKHNTPESSVVTQTKSVPDCSITAAATNPSHQDGKAPRQIIDGAEPAKSPAVEVDKPNFAPEQPPQLMPTSKSEQDKSTQNVPPHIVSAVVKEALSEQPTKKASGKQNNREKSVKQPITSKLGVADKPSESKPAESLAIEGKVTSMKTVSSQSKDKQKEHAIKKGVKEDSRDSESNESTKLISPPGSTQAKVKQTVTTAEKPSPLQTPKDCKSSTTDSKSVFHEPLIDSATNKTGSVISANEENNKKAAAQKNKQKIEGDSSKSEQTHNTKKPLPDVKNKVDSTTENVEQSTSEINVSVGDAKKKGSKQSSDKVKKPQKVETITSDGVPQSKQEDNKVKQQTKLAQESQETNTSIMKEDQQAKSASKKKNKQQTKISSSDKKPTEKKDAKVVQETKTTEKSKPTPSTKEKPKVNVPQTETTDLGNLPGETGVKTGLPESQPLAKDETAQKQEDNEQTLVNEEQIGSKKKNRKRHKKKNKMGEDEKGIGNADSEEKKGTVVSGEPKTKEKCTTKSPQEKGQNKDVQTQQSNKKKGKQPAPGAGQDEPSLKKEGITEDEPQAPASKKRKRRRKKTAEKDKDADETKPDVEAAKSNKQEEASELKPISGAEGARKKVNDSKVKSKSEIDEKRTDNQASGTDIVNVENEDQQEKFVEVKSKSKRNKKNKSSDTHVDTMSTSSDVLNSNLKPSEQGSTVSSKEEKLATTDEKTKLVTNKVAAPKLSPEAREQKMLKKKLAERAQQKIQQQIESNCLSEAEKSEKYLETITKNLKELTKLRSSKLEDILQKSAADGEEEFDYEYSPVQRTTFLATTCHICKESKPKENLRICNMCHMISYCSEDHQKSDWPVHKDLCQAVSEICKERGTGSLFAPAAGLTAEDYRTYRMNALLECSAILNRPLEPYEQEMILYPNICQTCHLPDPAKLQTCDKCELTSYCSPEHRQLNHDVWCPDLQLFKSLIVYQSRNGVINPQLPEYYLETAQPPASDMRSFIELILAGRDASILERAAISEIATAPLTTLFALYKANKISESTEKLVVHFVGAEWSFELERADKWETLLLHLLPGLKALVLVFVGPEVASLPEEARKLVQKQSAACARCRAAGRGVELAVAPQRFYHEYAASADYVKPDAICAFNAGLYRQNGYQDVDSWAATLGLLLKDPSAPLAVTSYTAEEMLKDVERLQQRGPLNFLLAPTQNPYRSLRPNRNFASDDVTPVIFKNFYITIATAATS